MEPDELTSEERAQQAEVDAAHPWMLVERRLIRQFAERRGGVTLEYLRLAEGPHFGRRPVLSDEECAKRLNVPVSTLRSIRLELARETFPELVASPEFKDEARRKRLPEPGTAEYWEVVKKKRRRGAKYGPAET